MIGLGKWACSVSTMFYAGEVKITVLDNNGSYGFEFEIPGVKVPDVTVKEVKIDGNLITAVAQTSILPGRDVELSIDFNGDSFEGFAKVPVLGKVKLKNGHRIEE